jgi:hypothetical protein
MHVDRHASIETTSPPEDALARVESAWQQAAMHPGMLAQLVDDALAIVDRGDGGVVTRRALHTGAQAGAALFELAGGAGEARLGRQLVRADGIDLAEHATAERWIRVFHLATVAGDLKSLRALARVGPLPGAAAYARWKQALQAWGRADPTWTAALADAKEALLAMGPRERALDVPLLDLAAALDQGRAAFEEALVAALIAHRSFHEGAPNGAIALGPLAYVALAVVRGLPFDVTSDYLPAELQPPRQTFTVVGEDAEAVAPILASLVGKGGPAAILALRPREEDYERVFASGAERARAGYEAFWRDPPRIEVPSDRTHIAVVRATTEDLAEGTGRAVDFPGGWRRIATSLRPGLTWVAWRYHRPDESLGTSFDGLVRLDDRWAWFPKPWRVLG